jgi:hypothetical protein
MFGGGENERGFLLVIPGTELRFGGRRCKRIVVVETSLRAQSKPLFSLRAPDSFWSLGGTPDTGRLLT